MVEARGLSAVRGSRDRCWDLRDATGSQYPHQSRSEVSTPFLSSLLLLMRRSDLDQYISFRFFPPQTPFVLILIVYCSGFLPLLKFLYVWMFFFYVWCPASTELMQFRMDPSPCSSPKPSTQRGAIAYDVLLILLFTLLWSCCPFT